MSVAERLAELRKRIAEACARAGRGAGEVRIVAVTKAATAGQIREAVAAGLMDLGENRVQVLQQHAGELGAVAGVRWHMIGHLQRNKVKQVMGIAAMIQSVDSLRLAEEIEKTAAAMNRRVPVLLEVNAGEEEQKFGAPVAEAAGLALQMFEMPHLDVQGLMSMAPLTADTQRVHSTFARTRDLFEQIRSAGGGDGFRELSMGMSGDFEIAIERGATIVRVGSVLFG